MLQHIRTLAILHVVFNAFFLFLGIAALLFFSALAGAAAGGGSGNWVGVATLGTLGTIALMFFMVMSLPGLLAGIGLLGLRPWGRTLGLIVSALDLLHVPFGTVLGIYGLWVLLSRETEAIFEQRALARPL